MKEVAKLIQEINQLRLVSQGDEKERQKLEERRKELAAALGRGGASKKASL